MYRLYNARYIVRFGFGHDTVCIVGSSPDRDFNVEFCLSTPVSCDIEAKKLTTTSGSVYIIESFGCNEDDFWRQVKENIELGGYETC